MTREIIPQLVRDVDRIKRGTGGFPGIPALASSAETIAGASTTKAVTPAGLKGMLPFAVVHPTGGDDTSNIQAAGDSLAPGGTLWFREGDYNTSGTLTFEAINIVMPMTSAYVTQITYSGTGTAVQITDAHGCNIQMAVHRTSRLWDSTDSTSIGVLLLNTTHARCTFDIREFCTGLKFQANAAGIQYCDFNLEVLDNKVGIHADIISLGWVNQNTFLGRIAYFSGAASYVGTIAIDFREGANGNTFTGFGLEGVAHEKSFIIAANYNQFINCRYEGNVADSCEFTSASTFNQVIGGFGNLGASDAKFDDSGTYNQIIAPTGMSFKVATAHNPNGLHITAGTGTPVAFKVGSSPTLTRADITTAGNIVCYDNAGKETDSTPIVSLDGLSSQRGIVFGFPGSPGTPNVGRIYCHNTTFMGIVGHILWNTHNTHDLGISTNAPRDIALGRNLRIGGAIDHDGTTIGEYGATPTAQTTGWGAPTGTATKTTFDTTTVTLPQLAERVKAMIDYFKLRGTFGA